MTRLTKIKAYLTRPIFHFNRLQFNLVALFFITIGLGAGIYLSTTRIILPRIFAADSPWTDTDWSTGADYTSKSNINNETSGEIKLGTKSDWYNSNWKFRKKIIFDNTDSNLDVASEELTNFPVLVKLNSGNMDYGNTQDSGQDIRFTDSDGQTPLNYEIEEWDEAGDSFIWVKVPAIDEDSDEDYVYIYYGNDSAVDGQDGENVWNTNFKAVYHLNETTGDSAYDSTSNNVDAVIDGSVTMNSSGQINGADAFNGNGDNFENTSAGLSFETELTLEGWFKYSGSGSGAPRIIELSPEGNAYSHCLAPDSDGSLRAWADCDGASYNRVGSTDDSTQYDDGQWHYFVYTYSSPNSYLYVDGLQTDEGNVDACADLDDTTYLIIGAVSDAAGNYSHTQHEFDGGIDELRVSDNARSPSWIAATFHTQTDDFNTFDSEEDRFVSSGELVSTIFDAGFAADWGDFVFDYTGSGTVTVRARTSNNSDMSGADSWTATCNVDYTCDSGTCTSDASLEESTSCVTNEQRYFQYQVVLEPDGSETPTFTEARVHFQASDQTDPEVQASNSKMYTANGGTEITDADEDSDSWTNDSIPYFSWTEGEDDAEGSGILGYCLYLGTSSDGDPRTSKGILGTSPESTASTDCDGGFIIGTNEIDLTTSSYRGSSWLSSNGSYYLNITAIDNSGNAKGTPFESFHFQYDGTNPTNPSGLSAPQTYQSQIENITIYWATTGTSGPTDTNSGVAGYQYRIGDTGTWYGSGHTGSEDINDLITAGYYTLDTDHDELSEGENTFYLRTWDNAGNVSDSAISAILKYSGNAPSEPNELAVTPTTNDENSFGFSWSTPTTYDGQTDGLSYCYTINAVPSSTNCSWTSETSLSADAYATQPSTNTFYVVAKDEAGNVNYDAYASVNFDCDTSAPGVPQSMDIADVSVKATSSWKLTVSWEEPDDTGAGVETYQIYHSTDGDSYTQTSTSTGISYVDTGLTQVTHYYKVRACDSANNCGAFSEEVSLYPDGKFTEPAGLTAGPTVSGVTTKKATISWSTDRTADSKIQYGTSSGDYFDEEVSSSTHTTDHSIALTNLSAGQTYYYRAKWTDEDGNTGMSEEKSFTTDPAPSLSAVEATDIGLTSAYINFTISNATKASIQYGETTSYGGLKEVTTSTNESNYSVQLTGLADGTKYHYRIIMEDSEGEEYISDNYTDLETLPRPRISQVRLEEITGSAQPAVLVSWQTNTSISSILTYYPTDNPGQAKDKVNIQLKQGEHRMLLKDLLPDKTYVLVVKGRDKVGNEAESDQQTFTTATDTRPPVIGNLKVEGTIQGTGEEAKAQLLVSFNTDEPATSQVEFGEGTGTTYSQKTQEDADLTNNHLVIVPNLSPSKVYHLRAIAKDKAGNETKSVDTVSITPKATESALNLVITNLSEVFGFLNQSRP